MASAPVDQSAWSFFWLAARGRLRSAWRRTHSRQGARLFADPNRKFFPVQARQQWFAWKACDKHSLMLNSGENPAELLRRIGVLGDIHCEDGRLAAALEFLQTQALDLICAVGDLVDGPGDVNRTIELLWQHRVIAVRGNHERWLFGGEMRGLPDSNSRVDLRPPEMTYLSELPLTRRLETVAGNALLCHGLGSDDMAGVWPQDDALRLHSNYPLWQLVNRREYRFVLNGHTHERLVRSFEDLTIINAGTLFRKHNPCFCIADFAAATVQYFDVVTEVENGHFNIVAAERLTLPPLE
jgi:predicted phosphodiesterase